MEITIYPDVLFLINFSMDFFLLWLLRMILKLKGKGSRLAAGSTAGAILSVLALYGWLYFMPSGVKAVLLWLWSTAGIGSLMVYIAFWPVSCREFIRADLGLFFGAAVTQGVLEWGDRILFFLKGFHIQDGAAGFAGMLFFLAGGCLLAQLLWRGIYEAACERSCRYQVTLFYQGSKAEAEGFLDTGNRLKDPISGRPVHVADRKLLEDICPKPERIAVIPYRTIDGGGLTLTAVMLDRLEAVQGKRRLVFEHPLVAVSPGTLKMKNGCRILLHE